MNEAFLIPASGLNVRNPQDMAILPEAGAVMPLTSYWKRRIKTGDVVVGSPKKQEVVYKKYEEKEKVNE
jgi:hypothetical protein